MLTERCRLPALLLGAVIAVSLPACARKDDPRPPEVALRIGAALPRQGITGSGVSGVVLMLTTEAMITNEPDGRQSGRLASSWTWNPDHTVLQMKLRRDVLFHDGTRLTPELAAEALRGSIEAHEAFSFGSVTSVAASGEDSIELRLSAPDSFLLPDLSLVSLRLPGHPEIGTGPFQVTRERRGEKRPLTVLRAFDKYYGGRPSVDRIDIEVFENQRQAWAAMMRGGLDVLHEVSRDALEFVQAETTVNTYSFPRSYYIPLVFNVKRPVLKRADVRRAINEGIDKKALVSEGLRERGRAADGPIWPEHWAYSSSQRTFAFNPEAARLRLDNAGLPIKVQPSGIPARFSFSCLVLDDVRFARLALVLQKQLWDIGIDMRLEPVTVAQLAQRFKTGDFDAFLFELAGRSLSWVYAFWHSPPGGVFLNTGYTAADAVLDRIRHARSDEEVRAGVSDLSRILYEDPPAAFLAWQAQSRAVSKQFQVVSDTNRDVLSTVWQWRRAPEALRAAR
jgi:peptide/nickel transport system substrate-binding protein